MTDACLTGSGCNKDDPCDQCNLDVFFRAPEESVTLTDTQVLLLLLLSFAAVPAAVYRWGEPRRDDHGARAHLLDPRL